MMVLVVGYGERQSSPCRQQSSAPRAILTRDLTWRILQTVITRPASFLSCLHKHMCTHTCVHVSYADQRTSEARRMSESKNELESKRCACLITCTLCIPRDKHYNKVICCNVFSLLAYRPFL